MVNVGAANMKMIVVWITAKMIVTHNDLAQPQGAAAVVLQHGVIKLLTYGGNEKWDGSITQNAPYVGRRL